MKEYLSIPREIRFGIPAYVFDKLDGSNIRAEWNKKKGFHKFGSKNRLIGTDQLFLPEAIPIIKSKYIFPILSGRKGVRVLYVSLSSGGRILLQDFMLKSHMM